MPEIIPATCRLPDLDLPRLGLIALSTDLTFERDAARLLGWNEAILHVTRIRFQNPTTPENLRAMGPDLATAAAMLVPGARLAALAFACTSASVTISNEVVAQAIGRVQPDVPVVTPSLAAVEAFRVLGVRRIALLTPYLPETTVPMIDFLEDNGLSVVRCACFGLGDDRDMARLSHDCVVEAAVGLDHDDVEGVFLSCTAMPGLDVIAAIEARIGKPVVGSNQATLWRLRALAGLPVRPEASGTGRLFDAPVPAAAGPG
ncbi:aspartate/glutamate racemase family protein [Sulfitobacter alexandrii]|uniref:maleate cis-trans isomerase family protein n=1 Tax=Sulfitobacter alexandrii TaxID=1917485 RepID=UPI001C12C81E|nr:aspartate/glutamate racemase family protein [Sulfitobacter alexandrii]